jgi:hypothetical protein
VRYDGAHFPEGLRAGETNCHAAASYRDALPERFSREAVTLANLTGWDVQGIRTRMEDTGQSFTTKTPDVGWWLLDRVFGP